MRVAELPTPETTRLLLSIRNEQDHRNVQHRNVILSYPLTSNFIFTAFYGANKRWKLQIYGNTKLILIPILTFCEKREYHIMQFPGVLVLKFLLLWCVAMVCWYFTTYFQKATPSHIFLLDVISLDEVSLTNDGINQTSPSQIHSLTTTPYYSSFLGNGLPLTVNTCHWTPLLGIRVEVILWKCCAWTGNDEADWVFDVSD